MNYSPKTEPKREPGIPASTESMLDEALAETFPASDPIAVHGQVPPPNPDDKDEHKERRQVRRKRPAAKRKKAPARKARSKKKAGKKKAAKKKISRRPAKKRARKRARR